MPAGVQTAIYNTTGTGSSASLSNVPVGKGQLVLVAVVLNGTSAAPSGYVGGNLLTFVGPPSSATNNVFIGYTVMSAAASYGVSLTFSASVAYLVDVFTVVNNNTATPIGNTATDHSTSSPFSTSINHSVYDSILFDYAVNNSAVTTTVDATQTQLRNATWNSHQVVASTKKSTSGTNLMSWTAASGTLDQVVFEIQPNPNGQYTFFY